MDIVADIAGHRYNIDLAVVHPGAECYSSTNVASHQNQLAAAAQEEAKKRRKCERVCRAGGQSGDVYSFRDRGDRAFGEIGQGVS